MRKYIALFCALAMLLASAVPAISEEETIIGGADAVTEIVVSGEGMTAELENLTLSMKTLFDIGDEFTDFTTYSSDGRWDLYWSGDNGSVHVNCAADGTVYEYYCYDYNQTYSGDYAPRFPRVSSEKLTALTNEFLGKVITGENQSWVMGEPGNRLSGLNGGTAAVSGYLTVNGYRTDVTLDVSLDLTTGRVTNYYRNDYYRNYSSVDYSDACAISDQAALELLKEQIQLRPCYYVVDEKEMARLVYMPVYRGNFAVRASDGELINLDDMYNVTNAAAKDAAFGAAEEAKAALTEVELKSIGAYENALAEKELDAILRGIPEVGLTEEYFVTGLSYDVTDGKPMAYLNYAKKLSDKQMEARYGTTMRPVDGYDTKNFTLDACSGRIVRYYSYQDGVYSEHPTADVEAARPYAEAFVQKYYPDEAANMEPAVNDAVVSNYSCVPEVSFHYSRVHNGYPFDANGMSVTIDAESGEVLSAELNWSNTQEFCEVNADEVISPEEALDTYLSCFEFTKLYLSIPVAEESYNTSYEMRMCWQLVDQKYAYALDAVTGGIYTYNVADDAGYAYDDIADSEHAATIATLGKFGVGFSGGAFRPDDPCTWRDMLVMTLQANGAYNAEALEYSDLVSQARSSGAVSLQGGSGDEPVTRADYAGLLVELSGYAKAAALKGIYRCDFTDEAKIAEEHYSRIALAYGMGLIAPDEGGNIRAEETLTRGEAAEILFNLLSME